MEPKVPTEQPSLLPRDPVLSFVDMAYDQSDLAVKKTVAENLQRMVDNFSACQGQFFLVVKREKDSFRKDLFGGHGLMPPHDFSYIKTDLYMSLISGEFQFGGELAIPFRFPIQPRYAAGDLIGKPVLFESERGALNLLFGFEVMVWLEKPKGAPDLDQPGLDIAVGDEEVKDLIRAYRNVLDKHYGDFPLMLPVYKMCHLLGRYLHNFPEQTAMLQKSPELFREPKK